MMFAKISKFQGNTLLNCNAICLKFWLVGGWIIFRTTWRAFPGISSFQRKYMTHRTYQTKTGLFSQPNWHETKLEDWPLFKGRKYHPDRNQMLHWLWLRVWLHNHTTSATTGALDKNAKTLHHTNPRSPRHHLFIVKECNSLQSCFSIDYSQIDKFDSTWYVQNHFRCK